MRRHAVCSALVALALTAAAGAQPARSHGRVERDVVTNGEGPRRLAVDLPLLSAANERLSDLRLFDSGGRELPYLLIYPDVADEWVAGSVQPVAVVEDEKTKTSGFEADLGSPQAVDMVRVEGLPAPFLKRLVLEGSGDRERWTLLQAQGTLFDLPQERLRQLALPFRAGTYRYLRVTWDDTHSGRVPLPRGVSARRAETAAPAPQTALLTFDRIASEPGRSRFRIRLPRGRLPIVALTLDAGGDHVFRTAIVTESRIVGTEAVPAEIGRAIIARVTRNQATASQLRLPIATPQEAELQLVVDDGNNPPLDLRGVTAEFAPLPWIYFEAPAGPVVARYGDPRAQTPSYDLEAARKSIDIAGVTDAMWTAPRTTSAGATEPPPAKPDAGAPLDKAAFRVERTVADGEAGLVALAIDPAMLAESKGPAGRFADVRVVDDGGKQIPYLVERRDDPLVLNLELRPFQPAARELRSETGRIRSTYSVHLPHAQLPAMRLVLETSGRVFQRTVHVGFERKADRHRREAWFQTLASAMWQHADQNVSAPPLTLALPPPEGTDVVIVVDEGDNAQLPMTAVRALLPSYRLRFYHPGRPLRVVYGRDDLAVPQYDLALLAPQVMGAAAREISPAPPGSATTVTAVQLPATYFWVGLGAAVLVLLGIIVRLVRRT